MQLTQHNDVERTSRSGNSMAWGNMVANLQKIKAKSVRLTAGVSEPTSSLSWEKGSSYN